LRVGLVGCTKTKLDHRAPARDLYSASPMFRGRRFYVETTCDRWFILSAKHGVVDPGRVLSPYDVSFIGASRQLKRDWAQGVLLELESRLGELRGTKFEIHAGRDYWDHGLEGGLLSAGASVTIPTKGMSQGEQLAFYKKTRLKSLALSPTSH
jgi:hypothetical protein